MKETAFIGNGIKVPKLRSKGVHLVAGARTEVYRCPNNYTAKVDLLFVANIVSGNKTVTIEWYNSNVDDHFHIVGGYVISGYNYLMLSSSYLVLNAGDAIFITSEAGSTMDASVSVEEYYDPISQQ